MRGPCALVQVYDVLVVFQRGGPGLFVSGPLRRLCPARVGSPRSLYLGLCGEALQICGGQGPWRHAAGESKSRAFVLCETCCALFTDVY